MDKEKAVSAAKAGLWIRGIVFVVRLAADLIGRPTILIGNAKMPAWTLFDSLRDASVGIGLAVVGAVASYVYQVVEERRAKSKL
jgi:hypothetical protein